jgi:hypothetical protein
MENEQKVNLQGSIHDIECWIWNHLIPKSGQSSSVQGELLRAIEKLRWEAQNNGNGNWDDRFEMFLEFLHETLCSENKFPNEFLASIENDLKRLWDYDHPYVDDDLFDRLAEYVVEYCRLHPVLIPREHDPNQYR